MMTTTIKDITNFLEDQGIEHHPIRIRDLLAKLNSEELEDLLNILEISCENEDGSI